MSDENDKTNEKVAKFLSDKPAETEVNNEILIKLLTEDYFRTGSGDRLKEWENPLLALEKTTDIDSSGYIYFLDNALPVLILGIRLDKEQRNLSPEKFKEEFPLNPELEFNLISQQGGGHACRQDYFYGMVIKPKADIQKGMETLSRLLLGSHIGLGRYGCPSLNDIIAYEGLLKRLIHPSLNCNTSYPIVKEAVYPIDFNLESVSILTEQNIPDDDNKDYWLAPRQKGEDESEKKNFVKDFFYGSCLDKLNFYILGHNCD